LLSRKVFAVSNFAPTKITAMNNTTVLIVGAGPVGLTLACELARRDISFRIIERSPIPPNGSRAKALQPRSLEIFNDLGIAEGLMQQGYTELPYRKFNGNQLIGDNGNWWYLASNSPAI
jgi:succinate dehydrogenase/fumarate reductase flavoprotein subunit